MKMRVKREIVTLVALLVCTSALGVANFRYIGNGADPNDWFDEANWSDPVAATNYPTVADNALFMNFNKGMTISQVVPAHGQMNVGRGSANTVIIAAGGVVTNLNQTVVGILDNGQGTLIMDGGSLVTKRIQINVAGLPDSRTVFKVKSGSVEVGLDGGEILLGQAAPGTLELSGGMLMIETDLQFYDGYVNIVGDNGSLDIGNGFNWGMQASKTTEVTFALGNAGTVSTIAADSFATKGTVSLVVDGSLAGAASSLSLTLIDLAGDTFSPEEFNAISNGLSVVGIIGGELSLSGDGSKLLFTGTTLPSIQLKAWEFNTIGDTENFLSSLNGHLAGLAVTNAINGDEGVLTCADITGVDPGIWRNQSNANSGLYIPSGGRSWRRLVMRLRQLDGNPDDAGVESQAFINSGTLLASSAPAFINFGAISETTTCTIESESDNWIVATYDVSSMGTNTIEQLRVDPIGHAVNTNSNFEIDYIRLYAGVSDLLTDSDGDGMPDGWEVGHGLDPFVTNALEDVDVDGFSNLYEFAMNGDPTNELDSGITPSFSLSKSNGIIRLNCSHAALTNALERDFHYSVEASNDSVSGTWSTTGFSFVGRESLANGYEFITRQREYSGESNLFVRIAVAYSNLVVYSDVTVILSYENWISGHELSGSDAQPGADPDSDGLTNDDEYLLETAPNHSDSDGDGMPDGWEVGFGLNPLVTNALADADSDSYADLYEFAMGGDPTNALEFGFVPSFTVVDVAGTNYVDYTHAQRTNATELGLAYAVELTDDPVSGPWADSSTIMGQVGLANGFEAVTNRLDDPVVTNTHIRLAISASNDVVYSAITEITVLDVWAGRFGLYGTNAAPAADPDMDGLSNEAEYDLETNPADDDTDSDGMPDGWEQSFGLTPSIMDADGDKDKDGQSNLAEYIAGFSPSDPGSIFKAQVDGGSGMVISWQSFSNRTYGVLWVNNLTNSFMPLATNIVYPANSHTDTVHGAETTGFYKVDVELK